MPDTNLWAVAVPAASGIAGAFLGAWLSRWNEQRKQRLEFAGQQLREFYSPMLSIRTHIRALSELRIRIEQSHAALSPSDEPFSSNEDPRVRALERRSREQAHIGDARKLLEFNDQQFRSIMLPQYERMLMVFQEKYWLAAETTRARYPDLLQYVELWKRFLAGTIPGEVLTTFDVREDQLRPLYENLEAEFEARQRMLRLADPRQ